MRNPQSKHIYYEMSDRIEAVSDIVYFVLVKMTMPGVVLPSYLITIFNYFILDLKDESFFLPFSLEYVYSYCSVTFRRVECPNYVQRNFI